MPKKTHGLSNTPIYLIYYNILQRCYNPRNDSYYYVGTKGVQVCPDWLAKDGFMRFYKFAIEAGYDPKKCPRLCRKYRDGDFSPENCYFIPAPARKRKKKQT